ncbi:hypothetical protein C1645_817863 [Glomus cerebriforme]|uniref:Uncharacterized protein n=1 Tax=Glomus cerebriforme TaxID=658196 RepID=A0A397T8M2_9GLOM|nr:hypothetical protein C1645_817863 [Glomus cerebriforme]
MEDQSVERENDHIKKTSYELVYSDKPCGGCSLIDELFTQDIHNEEDIPETIQIADFENSNENLDNDIDFNENWADPIHNNLIISKNMTIETSLQNQYEVVHLENKDNEAFDQPSLY